MVADGSVERHDKPSSSLSPPPSSSSSCSSSSTPSSSSSSSSSRLQLVQQALPRDPPPPSPLPSHLSTHFPAFRCLRDYQIITETAASLERGGFYWGPLGVEEAHRLLRDAPLGSFLVRDSRQKHVFFTLSYRAAAGPVSVRIEYRHQRFGLAGSERSFSSLPALLEHYASGAHRSLSAPYRTRPATLQEMCRRRIVEACGGAVAGLPLNRVLRDFLSEFPYKL